MSSLKDLPKREKEELIFLKGYKKGIEDAMKLANGEELKQLVRFENLEIR